MKRGFFICGFLFVFDAWKENLTDYVFLSAGDDGGCLC